MKHLFLVALLFIVSMTAVSAQQKSDTYTFNVSMVWSNEYIEAGEENGEVDDNFTQYFSNKDKYVGNSVFGGGYLIRDYENNTEVFMVDDNGSVQELKPTNTGNITFKLSDVSKVDEVLGYETEKFTWTASDGSKGEIWFAADLDFMSAKQGVNYPFSIELPVSPSNLGVVLKATGIEKNGNTFDFEVSEIRKDEFTIDTANYNFERN